VNSPCRYDGHGRYGGYGRYDGSKEPDACLLF
jgi:hypothetical protein